MKKLFHIILTLFIISSFLVILSPIGSTEIGRVQQGWEDHTVDYNEITTFFVGFENMGNKVIRINRIILKIDWSNESYTKDMDPPVYLEPRERYGSTIMLRTVNDTELGPHSYRFFIEYEENTTSGFQSKTWTSKSYIELIVLGRDSDNDGYKDYYDEFPNNPNEWRDTDNDGVGDNTDEFPTNSSEWKDSDGDGFGDNEDEFPHNPLEWKDSDNDGVGDNLDDFPNDPSEKKDSDMDGVGDNADAYPYNPEKSKYLEMFDTEYGLILYPVLFGTVIGVILFKWNPRD